MDPAGILKIITNSTWMVTKLVGGGPVEFTRAEYQTTVRENTRVPSLLQLLARVTPQGAGVTYTITEGNESGAFTVNPSTGLVSLAAPLDYEEAQQHVLSVEARAGEASSEARVVVHVQDENDHVPAFARDLHETQITEEDDRHLPKTIITVGAKDGDAGEYGRLAYTIEGDGVTSDNSSSFDVHPSTGAVLVLRPLDRDPPKGRAQWRLRVSATDGELDTHTDVLVNLKDVNDNAPYFPTPTLHASISEDTPRGASVVKAVATDHDDPREAQNARLTYSLEKNVVDESTGSPILAIDTHTGLITTALCCLDREKTQRYQVQVVATDGGGLKGTGTVVVEVEDVNDVPPRFSRPEWSLSVPEGQSPQQVLATLTVVDQDVTNNFTFRVVPGSGHGWQMFRVEERGVGAPGGDLRPKVPLDYENPDHRRGFRFRVEVTDVGEGGWGDKYHVDGTWVNLLVLDENDNPPTYSGPTHLHRTLPEDTPPPAHLATFTATDLDGGGGAVRYSIAPESDPGRLFSVDGAGEVRLVGGLDRETADAHEVLVLAVDDGMPPRTATATLTVNVTDVNDNPPFLSWPREVWVEENSSPRVVATVTLGDPDDWRQAHGPPFTLMLDPLAPAHVAAAVRVTHDTKGDGGRGVGVVATVRPLDREEAREVLVPLVVTDVGSLSATVTLTLHVSDLNDNPMTPGARTVIVHTLKEPRAGKPVPLGRVYVQDPDDQDDAAKTYTWRRPHPGFTLDTSNGLLTMDPHTADGSYDLGFLVNDLSQGQVNVPANVTVEVKSVRSYDVTQATLLTLEVTPRQVITPETRDGSSLLHRLVVASRAWVKGGSGEVLAWLDEVEQAEAAKGGTGRRGEAARRGHGRKAETERRGEVRVSEERKKGHGNQTHTERRGEVRQGGTAATGERLRDDRSMSGSRAGQAPSRTRVWVVAPGVRNLNHILLYHRQQLAEAVGVGVGAVGVSGCEEGARECGCWAWVELGDGFAMVDASLTAVVGPRVVVRRRCDCHAPTPVPPHTCRPDTCLNGGRCVPTLLGTRCICPYHTWGSRCKVVSRHFEGGGGGRGEDPGGGWVWLPALPACTEVHLSLEILTLAQDALILYSGPQRLPQRLLQDAQTPLSNTGDAVAPASPTEGHDGEGRYSTDEEDRTPDASSLREGVRASEGGSDVVLVELRAGRPFLLLDLGGGAVTLALNASYSLADNTWHRIDLIWKDELVEMIVDLCSGESQDAKLAEDPTSTTTSTASTNSTFLPDAHTCRGAARLPGTAHTHTRATHSHTRVTHSHSGAAHTRTWAAHTLKASHTHPGAAHTHPDATHILNSGRPLQLGGFAHPVLVDSPHGPSKPLNLAPFTGCVRNFRVNREVVDLGENLLSKHSSPGCPAADCLHAGLRCGLHARCRGGGAGELRCECEGGWGVDGQCSTPTTPATFLLNSYVRLALSFTPLGYTTTLTLRFRTRKGGGQLVSLSSEQERDHLALLLVNSRLCLFLQLHPDPVTSLCLTHAQVTDGQWHSVSAVRQGSATFLEVDDGDGDLHNSSVTLEGRRLMQVDGEQGVQLGGSSSLLLQQPQPLQYFDGCLDDVRIGGRRVPLPPATNATHWGGALEWQGVEAGCVAPSACTNLTCTPPLACTDTWRDHTCSCGEGWVLDKQQGTCEEEDQCLWQPCLNGGSCLHNNHGGGYTCVCPSGFSGAHCRLPDVGDTSLKISLGALVAILVWCAFLLLLVCAFLLHQHHKRSGMRRGDTTGVNKGGAGKGEPPPPPCAHTPNLLQLQLLHPPTANGRTPSATNPNIADVDVLQVEVASVSSSVEGREFCCSSRQQQQQQRGAAAAAAVAGGGGMGQQQQQEQQGDGAATLGYGDDLRNYCYEGEGSSPGSLSSCLESCSGSSKFLGGFREVAHMLES